MGGGGGERTEGLWRVVPLSSKRETSSLRILTFDHGGLRLELFNSCISFDIAIPPSCSRFSQIHLRMLYYRTFSSKHSGGLIDFSSL